MTDLFGRPGTTGSRTASRGRTDHSIRALFIDKATGRTVRLDRAIVPDHTEHPRTPLAARRGPVLGTKPSREWRGPAVAGIRVLDNGTVVLGGK